MQLGVVMVGGEGEEGEETPASAPLSFRCILFTLSGSSLRNDVTRIRLESGTN